ncbi:uncharacterized protein LOC106181823 [Lingula anatina]|uniref:Uncharacterized protein LOC106181823 n=1 Tax=Lingula anatina TaxID=7574 RepID=A0A1S3KH10_LINAN|nr:uncharacterized protein LOC106181823 [Lingula anatina]|eukprot:XP_013421777.1 uncharacterized protein LOC106181823 [Lingula anatina]
MRRADERRERPAEHLTGPGLSIVGMSFLLTSCSQWFSFVLAILVLVPRPAAAVDARCYDWQGYKVEEGSQYIPKGDDPCMVCVCEKGFPTMCASPSCSPPQCKMFEEVEGKCCEYVCVVSPIVPPATNGTGGNVVPNVENTADAASAADLGLRLAASTLTSILILALLLFMIHRLRKRRMLVMMRRLNSPSSERHLEDDTVAYVAGYDEVNIGLAFPPYEEPPPPYTPWKAPDILPPAYDTIANTNQQLGQENSRPSASVTGRLPNVPPAGYIAELISRNAARGQAAGEHPHTSREIASESSTRREHDAGNSSTLPLPCNCASATETPQSNTNASTESNPECSQVIRDRGPVVIPNVRVERVQVQNNAASEPTMSPRSVAEPMVIQSSSAADDYVPKGTRSSLVRQNDNLQIRRNSDSPRSSYISENGEGNNEPVASKNNTKMIRPESTLSRTSCNSGDSTEKKCGPQRAFIEQREDEIIVWRDRDSPRVSLILRESDPEGAVGGYCHDNPVMKAVSPKQFVKSFSCDHEQELPRASAFQVVESEPPSGTQARRSLPPNSLDFIFRPIDPDRNTGTNLKEPSPAAGSDRLGLINPRAVPLAIALTSEGGSQKSPLHAVFTPNGPNTRKCVGRSHSITSQMSIASVCSETGEMRERRQQGAAAAAMTALQTDASYPAIANESRGDTFRVQPDSSRHIPAVQSDSQLLHNKANFCNQDNVDHTHGDSPVGIVGEERRDNQHNGARVKQNHDATTAVGKSKKKSRNRARRKSSAGTKDIVGNHNGAAAESPAAGDKSVNNGNPLVKMYMKSLKDPNPKFKQYGFIDSPDVLSTRETVQSLDTDTPDQQRSRSVERRRSNSGDRARSQSRSRDHSTGRKSLSPGCQKKRHSTRLSGNFNYQSLPTHGSPEHQPFTADQTTEHSRRQRRIQETPVLTLQRSNSETSLHGTHMDRPSVTEGPSPRGSAVNTEPRGKGDRGRRGRTISQNRRSLPSVPPHKSYV